MHQALDSMPAEQVRRRIRAGISQEGELLIDPEFFHALRQAIHESRWWKSI
jgi:hypothetical protein